MGLGSNKKNNSNSNSNNSNFERKDMSGSLFENDNKTNDNQPDLTGVVKIDGRDIRIAAWVKESKSGKEYYSLSFTEFDPDYQPKAKDAPAKTSKKAKYEEDDDDEPEEAPKRKSKPVENEDSDNNEDDEEALRPPTKGSSKPKTKK